MNTGKVKWFKKYNSPDEGPNGVTIANGVVYGATEDSAFALQASTGEQIWKKKLIRNANEGIDMAPGVDQGVVYVSTVPGNAKGFYKGNGQAILWAMDAKTGALRWKWDEVPTNLWSNAKFPFGTSRPGPNLYTNSIVKLNAKTGKLMWYYQLTPHDMYDWDMENSPVLSTVGGKNVVLDAGKGGILVAVDQQTGKLLWKKPVGEHNGHDLDSRMTTAQLKQKYAKNYLVCPGPLGGVETQLASSGTTVFAAANNLCGTYKGGGKGFSAFAAGFDKGTGDFYSLDEGTGKVNWVHHFTQGLYGAASVTNDVVFTTTFDGTVWALNTKNGNVLWHAKLPAATNSPVAIAGNTVLAAGSFPQSAKQKPMIVAYRLAS
jgi:outer membrane protein assembly factor BamB